MTPHPRLDLSITTRPATGMTWAQTRAASGRCDRVLSALTQQLDRLDDTSEVAISFFAMFCEAASYEETRHLSRLGDAEGA